MGVLRCAHANPNSQQMKKILHKLIDQHSELADRMNYSYYWEVDGLKLTNIHLVKWYEKEYNTWANWVCSPDLMQGFRDALKDKHIDMDHNYNVDMINKLKKEYKHVSLLFSGGYDSSAIFFDFVKNGIHLDETIMQLYTPTEERFNTEFRMNGDPALDDYKHLVGKQTVLQGTENDLLRQWEDPYAFFSKAMKAFSIPMNMGMYDIEHHFKGASLQTWGDPELEPQMEFEKDSCHIKGIDKPQLVYYKGKWYVTAIDNTFGDRNGLLNTIYFWLHPGNVKGLLQNARKYRDFCLSHDYGIKNTEDYTPHKLNVQNPDFDPNSTLAFFSLNDHIEFNHILGLAPIYNADKKMSKPDIARGQRIEFIAKDRWDVGCAYARCMGKFLEIFPECATGFKKYNDQGKFAWFIDIDTMEIFTQAELIPNGFEGISTTRVQGLPPEELAKTSWFID